MFISNPDPGSGFFPIPDPGVKKSTGSWIRIRNTEEKTGQQYSWMKITWMLYMQAPLSRSHTQRIPSMLADPAVLCRIPTIRVFTNQECLKKSLISLPNKIVSRQFSLQSLEYPHSVANWPKIRTSNSKMCGRSDPRSNWGRISSERAEKYCF